MTPNPLCARDPKVIDMSETDGIGKPEDGGMTHQKTFIRRDLSYHAMKRAMAAAGLLLLLGTALQPAQGYDSPPERSPYALLGPRSDYHTYDSMVSELQALQSAHPDMVRMESIGKTYEGRDIWAVKLSDDVGTNDTLEPDVLIFGGIHAREVMGVEVPMYVLNYMLNGYGKNETLTKYLNTKETWFVPMINPDGHVWVELGHDWRQNRRPTTGGYIGVDLNRNWGYMFGVDNYTSDDPADPTYHGPYPFSENETVALRDLALRQRFATSLSFHSYGQLVLYPWGYTENHTNDDAEFSAMAFTMAAWNGYTDEQACTLYPTHGSSDDWLYANTSTKAFTIEMDTSFGPPPSQIDVTCPLNREPVLYLIGYPSASIKDAGILSLVAPSNGTVVEPDRPLNVTAKVMNCGSDDENISVEMEISSGGYSFRNSTSLQLRAGQVGQAVMAWNPPMPGAENYTIDVRTNLTGDLSAWNDHKGAGFRIRAKYGAALNATGNTTAYCFPGENARFTLNLTSLSNREDDILFEGSGNLMEWARLPSTVHLPPAGTTTVELVVSVPRSARPGETASISVRAQSSTGQGSAGTVSTTTKVLDPAPAAVAGKDVTVNVTQEVAFDGSASSTPMGNLTGYSWNFGDGNRSEGVNVRHTFSRRGLYVVNLTVTSDRGWSSTDSLNVTVDQRFKIELVGDAASLKVLPGRNVTVNFTVRNSGNGPDTVLLSLDALKWNASLDLQRADLKAGEDGTVRLTFTAPADSLAGATAMFRVKAASTENAYARADATLTATVDEVHFLTFNVTERQKTADAGGSQWFQAVFQNKGNIAENITLEEIDVPEGWAVRFSGDNLSVPAWNTTFVKITADIPAGELAGDYHFTVRDAELTVSVNERRALEARTDVQIVQVKPKGTALFNLTLTNKGNARAGFNLNIAGLAEGWTSDTPASPVVLEPGANTTVRIAINAPSNARPGAYNISIQAKAAADPNVSASIPVTVTVLKTEKTTATTSLELSGLLLPALVLLIVVVAVVACAVAYSQRKG
jgi:carboxypeptidase T